LGTITPFVSNRFHKEIGQDGGNRATDPGYCGGSFKAGKRFHDGINRQALAGTVRRAWRRKGKFPDLGRKMFQCDIENGSRSLPNRGTYRNLWNVLPPHLS
jgi:hypothetical protein